MRRACLWLAMGLMVLCGVTAAEEAYYCVPLAEVIADSSRLNSEPWRWGQSVWREARVALEGAGEAYLYYEPSNERWRWNRPTSTDALTVAAPAGQPVKGFLAVPRPDGTTPDGADGGDSTGNATGGCACTSAAAPRAGTLPVPLFLMLLLLCLALAIRNRSG